MLALAVLLLGTAGRIAIASGLAEAWRGTRWAESSSTLLAQLGPHALVMARPLDFGDSFAQIVRRDITVGGVPLIAFYQMDKTTGGLKRVQLERQRHGVNPAAFRSVLAGLEAAYGAPDLLCGVRAGPVSGYQNAAERVWRRDGVVIRAIFRDTTIEAFEGCLAGDPRVGPCGLAGQLLVRISPPAGDAAGCPAAPPR